MEMSHGGAITEMNSVDKKRRWADPCTRPYFNGKPVEGLAMFMTRKLGRLVVPVLLATSFQTLVAGESAGAPSTSEPSQPSTTKSTAKPSAKSATKPAGRAAVPKSPITISLTSSMRHGNLVVLLDGVPVFNEEFQKPVLLISQTTTWDPPVQVTAGKHKLTAKVYGTKGRTYISEIYDLEVSRTKGIELRFRMKGDKLTVEPAS
jgi:hypothetical protein